jgi:hypothetical protein
MSYREDPAVIALLSERLQIRDHQRVDYIFVDYRRLKEGGMIKLATDHLKLTLLCPLPFLADLHGAYLTPDFMTHIRPLIDAAKPVMNKRALLGINPVKAMILKGVVLFLGVNYQVFKSQRDALFFLTGK